MLEPARAAPPRTSSVGGDTVTAPAPFTMSPIFKVQKKPFTFNPVCPHVKPSGVSRITGPLSLLSTSFHKTNLVNIKSETANFVGSTIHNFVHNTTK